MSVSGELAMPRALSLSVISLIALLIGAAPALAAPSVDADIATCDKGSGDVAIAACTRLINSRKMTAAQLGSLHHNRAVEYEIKKDYVRSLADYDASLKLRPGSPDTLVGRGNAYNHTGKYDLAIATFNEALQIKPASLIARYNRGRSHHLKGDIIQARKDYEDVLAGTAMDASDEASQVQAKQGLASIEAAQKEK